MRMSVYVKHEEKNWLRLPTSVYTLPLHTYVDSNY